MVKTLRLDQGAVDAEVVCQNAPGQSQAGPVCGIALACVWLGTGETQRSRVFVLLSEPQAKHYHYGGTLGAPSGRTLGAAVDASPSGWLMALEVHARHLHR